MLIILSKPSCLFLFLLVWAGFPERSRDGNKFVVAEKPGIKQSFCSETTESIIIERKSKRENASTGFFEEVGNGSSPAELLDTLFTE